jgi:hypothetical protein
MLARMPRTEMTRRSSRRVKAEENKDFDEVF